MFATGAIWREEHVLVRSIAFDEIVNLLQQAIYMETSVLHQAHAKSLGVGSGCYAWDQVVPLGQGG